MFYFPISIYTFNLITCRILRSVLGQGTSKAPVNTFLGLVRMTETKGCHTGLSGACSELCINSNVNVLNLGLCPESRPKARFLPCASFFCPDNVRSRQVCRSKWPKRLSTWDYLEEWD